MANKVTPTSYFEGRFKRFAKKFPSLADELLALEEILLVNATSGEPLGAGLYKIRLANKDKGKGKSGGFRVITYLVKENADECEIFLIPIYDKSEETNIIKTDLVKLVKSIFG